MIWEVLLLHELDDDLARHCANLLCKPGSEMSREFKLCRARTPLCVTYGEDADPCAWIATHVWRGLQTIEGFVAPEVRRRGVARIGVLALKSCGHLDITKPVAVFAPACVELSYQCGFDDVRLFQRTPIGDWKEVRTRQEVEE